MMIATMASAHLPSAGLHTRFVRGLAARIFVHGGRLNVAGHWTFFECSHMFTFFIVKALRLNTHAHTHTFHSMSCLSATILVSKVSKPFQSVSKMLRAWLGMVLTMISGNGFYLTSVVTRCFSEFHVTSIGLV